MSAISSSENAIRPVPTAAPVTAAGPHQPSPNASPTPAPNLAREVATAVERNSRNLWRYVHGQQPIPDEAPAARSEHEAPSAEQIQSVEHAVDESLSGINLEGRSRLNQTQLNALIEGAGRLAALGKRDRVEQLLSRFEQGIEGWNSTWGLASAERMIASVWAQAGDHTKALEHLERVQGYVSENPNFNGRGRGALFCSREDQPRLVQLASILPVLRSLYASDQSPQKIESALMRLRAKVQAHPDNVLATELRDQLEGSLQLSRRGV